MEERKRLFKKELFLFDEVYRIRRRLMNDASRQSGLQTLEALWSLKCSLL